MAILTSERVYKHELNFDRARAFKPTVTEEPPRQEDKIPAAEASAKFMSEIACFIDTLNILLKYRDKRLAFSLHREDAPEAREDTRLLNEQLEIIKSACDDCDDQKAYDALSVLAEKTWSGKTVRNLEEIWNALFLYNDFDGGAAKIGCFT
jgi:trehalose-6-phosphatase